MDGPGRVLLRALMTHATERIVTLRLRAFASAALLMAAACSSSSSADPAVTPDAGPAVDGGAPDAPAALDPRFFDPGVLGDDVFSLANPDPATIDVDALLRILAEAETQKSDGVVIARGDVIVAEKYFGHDGARATVQSITKSVVSLAIGALLDDGKIPSLDVPVSKYFAEWATGEKAKVTLRHLMAHTSGLQDDADGLFGAPDALVYARARPLATAPGASFAYSNVGTMLLGDIVKQAAGKAADAFVAERFFVPAGIIDWKWGKDPAGNVMTPGGLFLTPRDLLRLGRLVHDGGKWNGAALVSTSWISTSTSAPSGDYACYALLWWLIRDGCDSATGLTGTPGKVQGFLADGWGGNYIAVTASSPIVAVRTKTPPPNVTFEEERKTAFEAFPHEVATLGK
jgi:CubicO group peptidase (beta-lactamase class C family)